MQDESSGWEAGVGGSVSLIELGAEGSIDTTNIEDPIVGFIFGELSSFKNAHGSRQNVGHNTKGIATHG